MVGFVCCKNCGGVCWLQAFAAVLRLLVAREIKRLRAGWLLLLLCCCELRRRRSDVVKLR